MKVNGLMICSMGMDRRAGETAQSTTEDITRGRNMEEEFTVGTMAVATMEIGMRTKLRDLELILGLTVDNMKVNGWITTWTVLEFTHGKMDVNTAESTRTTKSMATVSTHGQMEEPILATGAVANSMDSGPISFQDSLLNTASGRKANASNGLTRTKFNRSQEASLTTKYISRRQRAASL